MLRLAQDDEIVLLIAVDDQLGFQSDGTTDRLPHESAITSSLVILSLSKDSSGKFARSRSRAYTAAISIEQRLARGV